MSEEKWDKILLALIDIKNDVGTLHKIMRSYGRQCEKFRHQIIRQELKENVPAEWEFFAKFNLTSIDGVHYKFNAKNGILVKRKDNGEIQVFIKSSPETIKMIKDFQSEPVMPKIVWTDNDEYFIREWIHGVTMRDYWNKHKNNPDDEWVCNYIKENYRMWKLTGYRGDYFDTNIIVDENGGIRWIDIGFRQITVDDFVYRMYLTFRDSISKRQIQTLLGLKRTPPDVKIKREWILQRNF